MTIDVLTIFPAMFDALNHSILGRAQEADKLTLQVHDIRPYSTMKHKNTDDYPFGGGAGMLMTAPPIAAAIKAVSPEPYQGLRIFMSPRGVPLTQQLAQQLSKKDQLLILCGHYEGVDERVIERYIDLEISIGDYVLTGGELPAMVLIDSISRLREGVLGGEESAQDESFSHQPVLEYPQYTRPREFEGLSVPEVLLSGDHAKIAAWRWKQSLLVTAKRRPDLLDKLSLSAKDRQWLLEALSAQDDAEESVDKASDDRHKQE